MIQIICREVILFTIAMCVIKSATSQVTVEIAICYIIGRIIGFLLLHK